MQKTEEQRLREENARLRVLLAELREEAQKLQNLLALAKERLGKATLGELAEQLSYARSDLADVRADLRSIRYYCARIHTLVGGKHLDDAEPTEIAIVAASDDAA